MFGKNVIYEYNEWRYKGGMLRNKEIGVYCSSDNITLFKLMWFWCSDYVVWLGGILFLQALKGKWPARISQRAGKILLQLIWIAHFAKLNTRAMFPLHDDYLDLCHFHRQMDKRPTYTQVYRSQDVASICNWRMFVRYPITGTQLKKVGCCMWHGLNWVWSFSFCCHFVNIVGHVVCYL